jgi:AcrR family transcriptional regulator
LVWAAVLARRGPQADAFASLTVDYEDRHTTLRYGFSISADRATLHVSQPHLLLANSLMPRRTDARQKMIESAAVLFREHGVHGTSFSDVLAHSGAPRGSIYHHFRGGKTQLAEETTRWAGEYILAATVAVLNQSDTVGAIDAFRRWSTDILRDSDYAAGCVIVAATLEGEREPTVRDAAAEAFAKWEKVLADALRERGVPTARSRSVATLLVAAIEGAIVLSRAQRTTKPLECVCRELTIVVADVLDSTAVAS